MFDLRKKPLRHSGKSCLEKALWKITDSALLFRGNYSKEEKLFQTDRHQMSAIMI